MKWTPYSCLNAQGIICFIMSWFIHARFVASGTLGPSYLKFTCTIEALLYANTCLCNILHGILLNGQVHAASIINDDADWCSTAEPSIISTQSQMFCKRKKQYLKKQITMFSRREALDKLVLFIFPVLEYSSIPAPEDLTTTCRRLLGSV